MIISPEIVTTATEISGSSGSEFLMGVAMVAAAAMVMMKIVPLAAAAAPAAASALSTALPAIISGGASLIGSILGTSSKNKESKERQAFTQEMFNGAPQFQHNNHQLFGYSTSPMQDMLNYGFMNSLINDLAPMAGMNLGEGFAEQWNQYSPENYAFNNREYTKTQNQMGGSDYGMQGTGGQQGEGDPYRQALMNQMGGQPRMGNTQFNAGGNANGGQPQQMPQQGQMSQGQNPMFEALKGFLVR